MTQLDGFDDLRGPILRSVSRSFYLSLRFLPGALRNPLSLAYLLARATDTLADTPGADAALRNEALRTLAGAIEGSRPKETVALLRSSFGPLQNNEAERALIAALPSLLDWLDAAGEDDRREIREVLKKITAGQTLDLDRFSSHSGTHALSDAAELDQYTYLVAGCVGEFWTRLCFAHIPEFSLRPRDEMLEWGGAYGKGLQLTNILRDLGSDLREGRCYLPADELQASGVEPDEIRQRFSDVEPLLRKWREKAQRGLAAGIDYACAVRHRRIRFATALPALIGARTLALLEGAGAEAVKRAVKVSRAEVRSMILTSMFASPRSLRARFEKASRPLT